MTALEDLLAEHQSVSMIVGGDSRQESEYCALQHLRNKATDNCLVAIHDAARSFISSELLTSLVNTAKEFGSAAPYLDNSKFYDIENNNFATKRKIVRYRHLKFIDIKNCLNVTHFYQKIILLVWLIQQKVCSTLTNLKPM